MPRRFKVHCTYSYIAVTLQMYIVKIESLKEKKFLFSEKKKAITEEGTLSAIFVVKTPRYDCCFVSLI